MSELLVLHELFTRLKERDVIDLSELYAMFEGTVLAPYIGDIEALKQIIFRLQQQGIITSTIEGNVVKVQKIHESSNFHRAIDILIRKAKIAGTVDEFKEIVWTSELNRYFLDEEEIKSVFFFLDISGVKEKGESERKENHVEEAGREAIARDKQRDDAVVGFDEFQAQPAPIEVEMIKPEFDNPEDVEKRIDSLRNDFQRKVNKIITIAKNYVEKLLSEENVMDMVVLRYLLNDLLPLKDIHLNADGIIRDAIREKNLPWTEQEGVLRRTGLQVDVHHRIEDEKKKNAMGKFVRVVQDCLVDNACTSFEDVIDTLDAVNFHFPNGEDIESLLEFAIENEYLKAYVDLVDQTVNRPRTEQEMYQVKFQKEIEGLSGKLKDDVGEASGKIPEDLEVLLMNPDKPKDLSGILEVTEEKSRSLKEYLVKSIPAGETISIDSIINIARAHEKESGMPLPFSISRDAIEKVLEELVIAKDIDGYFIGDGEFLRKKEV